MIMGLKFWFILLGAALIIEVPLFIWGLDPWVVMAIAFVILLTGYLCWWIGFNRWLNGLLDEKCDPERYVAECRKFASKSKRIAMQNFFNINTAVGLISLGRADEALNLLISEVDLQPRNSKMFKVVYHLALFCCYLNKDDFEKATFEYENHLKDLRKGIYHPKTIFALDASFFEYQYKLNRTPETAKVFLGQLDYLYSAYSAKLGKRAKLNTIYNKACLLLLLGDAQEAAKKFKTVAEHGNGLAIAASAKEELQALVAQNPVNE